MLLIIENRQITSEYTGYIDTTTISHVVTNFDDLWSTVNRNLTTEYIKPDWLRDMAVLASTNAAVNTLNHDLLSQLLPSQKRCYRSVDTVTDLDHVTHFPTEFLNSYDLPPHELHLKVGSSVIFLHNLNTPTLCNGTHLVVKQMTACVNESQITMGHS
eukprot:XP_014788927.1 PREDICTED: uncharacterized protein LOC106882681 [Octopus bimaculoides]